MATHSSILGKNPPAMWETWVRSLGWKDPLEKGMSAAASTSKSHTCTGRERSVPAKKIRDRQKMGLRGSDQNG